MKLTELIKRGLSHLWSPHLQAITAAHPVPNQTQDRQLINHADKMIGSVSRPSFYLNLA
jgi:hypothetical protein